MRNVGVGGGEDIVDDDCAGRGERGEDRVNRDNGDVRHDDPVICLCATEIKIARGQNCRGKIEIKHVSICKYVLSAAERASPTRTSLAKTSSPLLAKRP